MSSRPSLKHLQIDKANTTMVVFMAGAAFITIFALMSSHALFDQLSYQNRIITAKQTALNQLQNDVTASKKLVQSYKQFVNTSQNIIGGSVTPGAAGTNTGNNAQIVLDALPSHYDFPALTTSLQFILSQAGVKIDSISGTEQNPGSNSTAAVSSAPTTSTTPIPGTAVAMPLQFSVDGPYQSIQNMFSIFEHSIRPFSFQTITISGNQADLTVNATVQSYYQPAKNFKITTETIR